MSHPRPLHTLVWPPRRPSRPHPSPATATARFLSQTQGRKQEETANSNKSTLPTVNVYSSQRNPSLPRAPSLSPEDLTASPDPAHTFLKPSKPDQRQLPPAPTSPPSPHDSAKESSSSANANKKLPTIHNDTPEKKRAFERIKER